MAGTEELWKAKAVDSNDQAGKSKDATCKADDLPDVGNLTSSLTFLEDEYSQDGSQEEALGSSRKPVLAHEATKESKALQDCDSDDTAYERAST